MFCISPFQGSGSFVYSIQGRRAPLRYALAPGYYISRPWRGLASNSYVAMGIGAATRL